MTQGLTNTQVLLNEYVKQEHTDSLQYATEDDFFEFFASPQVLKEYDLSDEEVVAGICDAGNDGGCDDDFVLEIAREVFDLYDLLGGTDKVAKGSELITALKKSLSISGIT